METNAQGEPIAPPQTRRGRRYLQPVMTPEDYRQLATLPHSKQKQEVQRLHQEEKLPPSFLRSQIKELFSPQTQARMQTLLTTVTQLELKQKLQGPLPPLSLLQKIVQHGSVASLVRADLEFTLAFAEKHFTGKPKSWLDSAERQIDRQRLLAEVFRYTSEHTYPPGEKLMRRLQKRLDFSVDPSARIQCVGRGTLHPLDEVDV